MSDVDAIVRCQSCRFWEIRGGFERLCRRNAPAAGARQFEVGRWSETGATDACGEGEALADLGERTAPLHCEDCVYWNRPGIGIDPGQRAITFWLGGRGRAIAVASLHAPAAASAIARFGEQPMPRISVSTDGRLEVGRAQNHTRLARISGWFGSALTQTGRRMRANGSRRANIGTAPGSEKIGRCQPSLQDSPLGLD